LGSSWNDGDVLFCSSFFILLLFLGSSARVLSLLDFFFSSLFISFLHLFSTLWFLASPFSVVKAKRRGLGFSDGVVLTTAWVHLSSSWPLLLSDLFLSLLSRAGMVVMAALGFLFGDGDGLVILGFLGCRSFGLWVFWLG
jgi:hypothetical protein